MSSQKHGFRNNYHPRTSWFEVLGKDIKFAFKDFKKRLKAGHKLPILLVYPDFPSKKTTIFKIADKLNYRITNKLHKDASVVMYFEDITHGNSDSLIRWSKRKVLNAGCTDISKNKVDEVHLNVFGYNTFIKPNEYSGIAVRKSDINALHDGEIIQCPIQDIDSKSVYQLLIDNTFDDNYVVDYRVPVIGDSIPLVYKKFKEYAVRFTNQVHHATMHDTDSIFSKEEQTLILNFAKAMKVEFCEFDVLRHSDGRIFIIDVNKTPYGPPAGLAETDLAVTKLSEAFQRLVTGDR
jgi:hypothetical protein